MNIMVATKQYAEYVKAAVKAGIDLIISGAGLPMELPKLVAGSKTKIAPIVSTVKAARVICRFWDHHYQRMPDLVVIEGPKAGGHLSCNPAFCISAQSLFPTDPLFAYRIEFPHSDPTPSKALLKIHQL